MNSSPSLHMLQAADAPVTAGKVAPEAVLRVALEAVLQVAQAIAGEAARVVLVSAHLASFARSFSPNDFIV